MVVLFKNKIPYIQLIPVIDVNYDTFYQFIQFLYTDEYDVSECSKTGIDLLKLAIKYRVPRLENIMIDLLTNDVEKTCLQFFEFCVLENYEVSLNRISKKIGQYLSKYLVHDRFKCIDIKSLEIILNFDLVDKKVTEMDIFNAVMRWIEYNTHALKDDRDNMARKLLHLIRFSTMKADELVKCVSKIGYLFTDSEFGSILRQLASGSNNNNFNLCVPRKSFFWPICYKSYNKNDKFITKFIVQQVMNLNGIHFGGATCCKRKCPSTSIKIFANGIKQIEFRCYSSKFFNCNLNSLSELIFEPNIQYNLEIEYFCNLRIPTIMVQCRSEGHEGLITAPENSVRVELSGNVHEIIFNKKPS